MDFVVFLPCVVLSVWFGFVTLLFILLTGNPSLQFSSFLPI